MNKVHRKRLSNAAKANREMAKPRKFTMKHWGYGNSCGTPACALGNYAFRRDLQKTFKLNREGWLTDNKDREIYLDGCWRRDMIMDHFGITAAQVVELFSPSGCGYAKTHIQAAKYIEKFVAAH